MNSSSLLSLALIAAGLAVTAGCSKPDEPSPAAGVQPAVEPTRADTAKAINSATASTEKLDPQVQAQLDNLRQQVEKPTAQGTATTTLTSRTQATIDGAKKLLAENKWAEALQALGTLNADTLTLTEKGAVDTLKQQAQKLAKQAGAGGVEDIGSKASVDLLEKK